MNEQLQNTLNELLQMIKSGASLASEQIAPLVNEIVWYKTISSGIYASVTLFAMIIVIYIIIKTLKSDINGDDKVPVVLFSTIPLIINYVFFMSNLMKLIKCLTAPRLIVIDYISQLL